MKNGKSICTLCNYIYEESEGETRQGPAGSVPFRTLPPDWHCPECGGDKEFFQPCTCATLEIYEQTCAPHRTERTQ